MTRGASRRVASPNPGTERRGRGQVGVVFDVLTQEIGHHLGMGETAVLRMEGRMRDWNRREQG